MEDREARNLQILSSKGQNRFWVQKVKGQILTAGPKEILTVSVFLLWASVFLKHTWIKLLLLEKMPQLFVYNYLIAFLVLWAIVSNNITFSLAFFLALLVADCITMNTIKWSSSLDIWRKFGLLCSLPLIVPYLAWAWDRVLCLCQVWPTEKSWIR